MLRAMGKTKKKSFYAVRVGRTAGVYASWSECEPQVRRFPGAVFKGFSTSEEARSFVAGTGGYRRGVAKARYAGDVISAPRYSRRCHGYNTGSGSSASVNDEVTLPVVYSDGSCYNNGRHGASAGVGVYWGADSRHNISEKLEGGQTNQRAELVSACRALETALEQGHRSIEVRTDSSYTINAMTSWVAKWKKNGWRTSSHSDVKNREDLERLDSLCQQVDVKWTHVPGHRGIHGNEAADRLAKAGSQKAVE